MNREYRQEDEATPGLVPFATWLQEKCKSRHAGDRRWGEDLRALAAGPSRRACTFKSMTSYGSHYRVQADEEGP